MDKLWKIFNVTNHQENPNQSQEMICHCSKNGHHQKAKENKG
jgi:hypothetical protein